ncbi:60S ribosomal protein L18a-1 [Corchorus olitorius]|uniref:60S ribosomal protein L18a-1 n=1 Tax=Corchorus olitorius TaxID=93759 RepID=A0A1R3KK95_9ROSI|nr:60S ribosomal protein L18a-1 [Corchorus olitorius]
MKNPTNQRSRLFFSKDQDPSFYHLKLTEIPTTRIQESNLNFYSEIWEWRRRQRKVQRMQESQQKLIHQLVEKRSGNKMDMHVWENY